MHTTHLRNTPLMLALHATDCEDFIPSYNFAEYAIKHDGNVLAIVRYEYDDGKETVIYTQDINAEEAISLDDFAGYMHIVMCVGATILHNFTKDHEFFVDVFLDEEGGAKELPLLMVAL